MTKEPKPQPVGGWPGMIRAAVAEESPADAALTDGGIWRDVLSDLERAGTFVVGGDGPTGPLDRMEGWRHLGLLLRMGVGEMLLPVDPDRPRFDWNDGTGKWGLDCADALYALAPVREGAVYRVRGRRGSVHFLGLQLVAQMRAVADLDGDDLHLTEGDRFELQVGGEKPSQGNWMALPAEASTLIIRQFFYDWDREVPATFEIDRIDDGPRLPPPVTNPGGIAAQLRALGRFVHDNTQWWAQVADAKRAESVNRFPDDGGGLGAVASASQKYQSFGIGYYRLEQNEALLIEVEPPAAKYWSLHLGNYWMESLDFANYQSSLNGHQARLDTDGVFRAVIALRDPGVPNWLDPAGHAEGSMIYRWNQADHSPIPATKLVSFEEIGRHLPADTPKIPAHERAACVERRRDHVRRRYARVV